MLGVIADAVNQLVGLELVGADFVDGGEEWELLFHVFGLQHMIDLFGGDWTLKRHNFKLRINWNSSISIKAIGVQVYL